MVGQPIPPAIRDAPELLETLQLFWQCFFDLRRGRDIHDGTSWELVQQWCEVYQIDPDLAFAVHRAIVEMDMIWRVLHPTKKAPADGVQDRNKRR